VASVKVLVIRAAGINCDEEVVHCWELAGALPTLVHVNALVENPKLLDRYQIVTIPGGFSYGDDIAAGVILAQQLRLNMADDLHRLVERGGGILGICNGFQVLVKMELLPGAGAGQAGVTVTYNDSARFEARWVRMQVCTDRCVFLRSGTMPEMPVEHAEGKVVTATDSTAKALEAGGFVAVKYVDEEGRTDRYPANPNGSDAGIAGLCDSTGRVFGLMPHPDRNFQRTHHPQWTRRANDAVPDGLAIFKNAVEYWQ